MSATRLGGDLRRRHAASADSSRSPSERCETTSASRASDSGRTRPLPAPRGACSACCRSSPCWHHASTVGFACRPSPQPGTASHCQPLPTASPPCNGPSGANRVFRCPRSAPMPQNFPQPSARVSHTHFAPRRRGPKPNLGNISYVAHSGSVRNLGPGLLIAALPRVWGEAWQCRKNVLGGIRTHGPGIRNPVLFLDAILGYHELPERGSQPSV